MNRPCEQCGRIITVPDIPLPPTYRQKCTACGYSNQVGRDSERDPVVAKPASGWDATFDKTLEGLELPTIPTPAPDTREPLLKEVPHHIDQEVAEVAPLSFAKPALTHRLVQPGQLIMGTRNTLMYQKVHGIFFKYGSHVKGVSDLDKLYLFLTEAYYQIIVLDQQFLTGDGGRMVFQHIKETPLPIRRAQTVVLITPGIPTGEPQVFYQWGIDLNIHPRDLDRVGPLVHHVFSLKESILGPLHAP